jgi:hypothetical protein
MSEPIRDDGLFYEGEWLCTAVEASGEDQTSKGVWTWRVGCLPGADNINLASQTPAEDGEDVRPDLLIDPPQPKPDEPQKPPGRTDC